MVWDADKNYRIEYEFDLEAETITGFVTEILELQDETAERQKIGIVSYTDFISAITQDAIEEGLTTTDLDSAVRSLIQGGAFARLRFGRSSGLWTMTFDNYLVTATK